MRKKETIEGQLSLDDIFSDFTNIQDNPKDGIKKVSTRKTKKMPSTKFPDEKEQDPVEINVLPRKKPSYKKESETIMKAPAHINEVMEGVMNALLSPGARYRIEEAVMDSGDSIDGFVRTTHEYAGHTYQGKDYSILFKKSHILFTDKDGSLHHIMWTPVYEHIRELVGQGQWMGRKQREKERKENTEQKERRRKWGT